MSLARSARDTLVLSCSPFNWMVQRTSVPLQFHPPVTPSSSSNGTSMMSLAACGPVAISPLQVGPSRARPRTRIFDDSIEKRYTLLPISCSNINIQSLRVANPALNSITCALTFPTGDATHDCPFSPVAVGSSNFDSGPPARPGDSVETAAHAS
jgi:hypothetical protein